ncbi:hypothetical protein KBI23_18185 [bacterium]|nr:hypothetical protein [bacterium]MBP9810844.1 hypothetical protein [bacterium]
MKLVRAILLLICSSSLPLLAASAQNIGNQYQNHYQSGATGNPQFSGQMPSAANTSPNINRSSSQQLRQWFSSYDMVRKQAQMSPTEKDRADNLLSQGLSVFVPGPNKTQAQKLLTGLVEKYQVAIARMKAMPLYPETEKLHRGYYQYFSDAKTLFSDYLRVQDNLMVKDENGKGIMPQLMARKANLESLEMQIKQLDSELRGQFGIAPYRN